MEKRDAYFDNAKLFLMILVVFGHFLQPFANDHPLYNDLYYFIFTFHTRVHPDLRFFREKWTKTLDDFSKKIVASLHFLSVVVLRLLHVDWSAGFLQS